MNFHAFWRPELTAMGDLVADRIVGPRLAPGAAGDPAPSAVSTDFGGLTGRRETLCYPGAVPGV